MGFLRELGMRRRQSALYTHWRSWMQSIVLDKSYILFRATISYFCLGLARTIGECRDWCGNVVEM